MTKTPSVSTKPEIEVADSTPELMSIDRQSLICDILSVVIPEPEVETETVEFETTFTSSPDQLLQLDDIITKFVNKQKGELIRLISSADVLDHDCGRMSIGGKSALEALKSKLIDEVLKTWNKK